VKGKVKAASIWSHLKTLTQARIGLHRAGHAMGTHEILDFQWAHAQARDAIHTPWNTEELLQELSCSELETRIQTQTLTTQVSTRSEYLTRPDLGRLLSLEATDQLKKISKDRSGLLTSDLLILVSNGLSSEAVHQHAGKFLKTLLPELKRGGNHCQEIFLIPNARVAIGDQVSEFLRPRLSLILIGERPGLSSSDGLSLYLTYEPRVGKTNVDRNCISNIREPHGLSYSQAVKKTVSLIKEAMHRKLSGVLLKDDRVQDNVFGPGIQI